MLSLSSALKKKDTGKQTVNAKSKKKFQEDRSPNINRKQIIDTRPKLNKQYIAENEQWQTKGNNIPKIISETTDYVSELMEQKNVLLHITMINT